MTPEEIVTNPTLRSLDFIIIVSAVLFGNALSALFFYAVWAITKYERKYGLHDSKHVIPGYLYFLGLIPPLVAGAGGYFLIP